MGDLRERLLESAERVRSMPAEMTMSFISALGVLIKTAREAAEAVAERDVLRERLAKAAELAVDEHAKLDQAERALAEARGGQAACTCPCHQDARVHCEQCCEGPPTSARCAV